MILLDVVNKFKNETLKEGQTFVLSQDTERYTTAYIVLHVGYNGNSLTCSHYNANKRIISNEWTIYKSHLEKEGFKEVSRELFGY